MHFTGGWDRTVANKDGGVAYVEKVCRSAASSAIAADGDDVLVRLRRFAVVDALGDTWDGLFVADVEVELVTPAGAVRFIPSQAAELARLIAAVHEPVSES